MGECVEVIDQLHTPTALTPHPGIKPMVPIVGESGWAPELVSTMWRRKILDPPGTNTDPLSHPACIQLLYCIAHFDCKRMCEDFALNFGDRSTGRLTLPFSPGNYLPKTTRLSFPTQLTFLFPRLKIKLKGHQFDTTDVIEAELQEVLTTLTEHDFQDAFKNITEELGMVHTYRRVLLRG
jgi:hypothetical protein